MVYLAGILTNMYVDGTLKIDFTEKDESVILSYMLWPIMLFGLTLVVILIYVVTLMGWIKAKYL